MLSQSYKGFKGLNPKNIKIPRSDEYNLLYAFPMHLIFIEDNYFHQTRSGPNWHGGMLTLTTCKHRMRTYRPWNAWDGVWLAGFLPKTDGYNYLLFAARVAKSFPSNYDLGMYLKHCHPKTYEEKLATNNPLGDIYEAKKICTNASKYNPRNFVTPKGHCRYDDYYKDGTRKWLRDIAYTGSKDRRAATFIFDQVHLYSKPMFYSTHVLGRTGYKSTVSEFKQRIQQI